MLLNQSHTYEDLILPIDEEQLNLFEAIDGERTIAEILSSVLDRGEQLDEYARSFFEQLWLYDQIVFDASRHERHTDAGDHRSTDY